MSPLASSPLTRSSSPRAHFIFGRCAVLSVDFLRALRFAEGSYLTDTNRNGLAALSELVLASLRLALALWRKLLQGLVHYLLNVLVTIFPLPNIIPAVSSPHQLFRFSVNDIQNQNSFNVV